LRLGIFLLSSFSSDIAIHRCQCSGSSAFLGSFYPATAPSRTISQAIQVS
jgi:hypothetical protein